MLNTGTDYYGVDTYALKGRCTSKNYDVTFTDAIFEVTPADISISLDRYDAKYNGKDLVVNVKEIIEQSGSAAVFGDMDWDDAQVLYKQADGFEELSTKEGEVLANKSSDPSNASPYMLDASPDSKFTIRSALAT